MLNRSQLILLTAMATLGGSFAGLLVVGMIAGDLTLAWINLGLIIAVFSSVFVIGSGSGESPVKSNTKPIKQKYRIQSTGEEVELSFDEIQTLTGANGKEERDNLYKHYFGEDYPSVRRSGDQHIGGEVLPEFK